MSNNKELAPVKSQPVVSADTGATTPAMLLSMAVEQGADLDKLEKLMELQEKWEKREARKAYVAAMALFKADPPSILKDKSVSYTTSKGVTAYEHASLGNIIKTVSKALAEQGFSISWQPSQADGQVAVTCTCTHELGHSESTCISSAPDSSGGKNSIQAIASTITYLERYTFLALTGLAIIDQDDDGRGAEPVPVISTDQAILINDLIKEKKADKGKFLVYIGSRSVEEIPAKNYQMALTSLQNKKGKVNADS